MAQSSGNVLRSAREASALTQQQVAELANTSQSAIAAYEAGAREPTLPVLRRMIAATGHVLALTVTLDPRLFRLVDLAAEISRTSEEPQRLRYVFEFLRSAQEDGHPLQLLVATEPAATGERRWDALVAAIAEDLCVHAGLAPPGWVYAADRFLAEMWWVSDLPSARARALVHSPASYRRRGVMIDRRDLVAA